MSPAQASTGVQWSISPEKPSRSSIEPSPTAPPSVAPRFTTHPRHSDAHTTTTRRSATNFSAGVEVSAAGSELLTGTEAVPRVPRNHAYDVLGETSSHPPARAKSMRNIAPSVGVPREVGKQQSTFLARFPRARAESRVCQLSAQVPRV